MNIEDEETKENEVGSHPKLAFWGAFEVTPGIVVDIITPSVWDMSSISPAGGGSQSVKRAWKLARQMVRDKGTAQTADILSTMRQIDLSGVSTELGIKFELVQILACGIPLPHAQILARHALILSHGREEVQVPSRSKQTADSKKKKLRAAKAKPRPDSQTLMKISVTHLNETSRLSPLTVEIPAILTNALNSGGVWKQPANLVRDNVPTLFAPSSSSFFRGGGGGGVEEHKQGKQEQPLPPMPNIFKDTVTASWIDHNRDGCVRVLCMGAQVCKSLVRMVFDESQEDEVLKFVVCTMYNRDMMGTAKYLDMFPKHEKLSFKKCVSDVINRAASEWNKQSDHRQKRRSYEMHQWLDDMERKYNAKQPRPFPPSPTEYDVETVAQKNPGDIEQIVYVALLFGNTAQEIRRNLVGDIQSITQMVQPSVWPKTQKTREKQWLFPACMQNYSLFLGRTMAPVQVANWIGWVSLLGASLQVLRIQSEKFGAAFRAALQEYFHLAHPDKTGKQKQSKKSASKSDPVDKQEGVDTGVAVDVDALVLAKNDVLIADELAQTSAARKRAASIATKITEQRIRSQHKNIKAFVAVSLTPQNYMVTLNEFNRTFTVDDVIQHVNVATLQLAVLREAQRMALLLFPGGAQVNPTLKFLCNQVASVYYEAATKLTVKNK
jgi:hypothetical protein